MRLKTEPHIYNARAKDTYGRTAQDSVSVNLPATVTFTYDANGNLTGDGRRVFEYDYENQLTNVSVASAWRESMKYDAFGRKRLLLQHSSKIESSFWGRTPERCGFRHLKPVVTFLPT